MHDLALGRREGAARELALVVAEPEDERGHFLQGIDAALGQRAVGRAAVDRDLKPDHAVVAAADVAAFAAFHDNGVVGPDRGVLDKPAGAKEGVGFLVGGEGHLDIHPRRGAGGAQGAERHQEARVGTLHVGGAAAIDPAAGHLAAERAAVLPLAGNRHDVVVGVEMNRFFCTGGPELAQDVVARESVLVGRKVAAQLGAGDREALRGQAGRAELRREQRGDGVVVLPGRIDGREADEPVQQAGQVSGVAVEIGGG